MHEPANDQDAGHFTVRAGCWLQGNPGETCDLGEMLLKLVNDLQRALRFCFSREWMKVRKSGDARDFFIKTRVVLHRARAKRVHALVDRIIPRRHAREVSDD